VAVECLGDQPPLEGDGPSCYPERTFADIARLLPGRRRVDRTQACESVVHVTAGSASYTLHTYNPKDFPRLQELETVQTFAVDRESMLETIIVLRARVA